MDCFFSVTTVLVCYDMEQLQFNLSVLYMKHAAGKQYTFYCGNITEKKLGVLHIFPELI